MLSFLVSPKGRFRRRDYWIGAALMVAILLLGLGADFVFRGIEWVPSANGGEGDFSEPPMFLGVAGILIMWPSLAMGIKRWHDRDKAWYFVLLGLIPLVNIYAYFSLFFLPGTKGSNRFGADPRDELAASMASPAMENAT